MSVSQNGSYSSTVLTPTQESEAMLEEVAQQIPSIKRNPAAHATAPFKPVTKVSIVIPVYNEATTIQTLVGLVVEAALPPRVGREVICVNDCSTDGTAAMLDELPTLYPGVDFRIHHKTKNEGKGAALRDGFKLADGEVVLVQDADLEYDPEDYMKLLLPICEDKADVVYG